MSGIGLTDVSFHAAAAIGIYHMPPRSAKQLAAAIDKVRQNVKEGKPVEDTLSHIADELRRLK